MSWYKTGEEGIEQSKVEDEKAASSQDPRTNRFWMKADSSTDVTFIDNEAFFLKEHYYKKGGHYNNFETCISDLDPNEECPFCESGMRYNWLVVFTGIDHTKYTTRRGEKVTATKRLLCFKSAARNKILNQRKKRDGDLTGCRFEFTRYTDRECNTGEDFDFQARVDVEELKKLAPKGVNPDEWIQPFNYRKIFKPKTPEQLRRILGIAAPVGAEEEKQPQVVDDKPAKPRSLSGLV